MIEPFSFALASRLDDTGKECYEIGQLVCWVIIMDFSHRAGVVLIQANNLSLTCGSFFFFLVLLVLRPALLCCMDFFFSFSLSLFLHGYVAHNAGLQHIRGHEHGGPSKTFPANPDH